MVWESEGFRRSAGVFPRRPSASLNDNLVDIGLLRATLPMICTIPNGVATPGLIDILFVPIVADRVGPLVGHGVPDALGDRVPLLDELLL